MMATQAHVRPGPARPGPWVGDPACAAVDALPWMLAAMVMPFDASRQLYGAAVGGGLLPRSMMANAAFEWGVALAEHLALGPWARQR